MEDSDNIIYNLNWYPNEYPNVNDIVVVKLNHSNELGNWVELLEYGSREAFIPQIPKESKFKKTILARVVKNNPDIDLTCYRIILEDIKKVETRFNNYRNLMKLILFISQNVKNIQFKDLVEKIVHPLHELYDDAYLAIKRSINEQEIIKSLDVSDDVKKILNEQVQKMFTQSDARIRALFEAEIFASDGVELLRNALIEGYNVEKEEIYDDLNRNSSQLNRKFNFSITIVAPPVYSVSIDALDAYKGLEFVEKVLNKIENKILEYNGRFSINEKPKAMLKGDLEIS